MAEAGEVELEPLRAPDDAAPQSPEHQRELWRADHELRLRGARSRSRIFTQDSVDAVMAHLGQMVVHLSPVAIPALAAVAGAWVSGRYGRKVRLKYRDVHGDVEVEARTPEEVELLLSKIPQARTAPPQGAGTP